MYMHKYINVNTYEKIIVGLRQLEKSWFAGHS